MPYVHVRKNLANLKISKLEIKLDITTLNMIIGFLYKDSVLRSRKALSNINKLFKSMDMSVYGEGDVESKNRIWIIEKTLDARLKEGFVSDDVIKKYCKDDTECDDYKKTLIDTLIEKGQKITYEESKYLLKQIDDRLAFGYSITLKRIVRELLDAIDETDIKSYKVVSEDLYNIATSIINIKRKSNSLGSEETFSLQEDAFNVVVADAISKLKNRNRYFITGIKYLNVFLAPAYMGSRLYTYLAFPGGGKSAILLESALDIRKYNADIETINPDNRPAVLFITMENTIEETVERIFNMTTSDDDIRNYSEKQILRMLKDQGELKLTEKNNIDIIIKYYPNRSISTNDLYDIIQDLEDDGIEVIALILDYLKRIRPYEPGGTEKEELKNITNELKTLAKLYNIPVITAQQLNRTASAVVDAAIQAKKEDVTRLVGRDGIAGAWEIIENSDVCIIINREKKIDTGKIYLTFKLLKRRYRSAAEDLNLRECEYFNQPYIDGSNIRLVHDVHADIPAAVTSLAASFAPADNPNPALAKRGNLNVREREEKKDKADGESEDVLGIAEAFEPFSF